MSGPTSFYVPNSKRNAKWISRVLSFRPSVRLLSRAAGQTVFYNNNILHCATYDPHAVRATLHASMGDTRGGTARARNVLQHGLRWMRGARFRETLPEGRARAMLDRLLDMEGSVTDVGYSLSV